MPAPVPPAPVPPAPVPAVRHLDEPGPPRVHFAAGAEAQVATLLAEAGAQRVLIVTTARHTAGGARVAAALGERCVGCFDGAEPQVPRASAEALVARIDQTGADWVLAHGGGTAVGVAKAAALERDVAIAAVPTTYSGSEMTSIWGITDDGQKTTGRDERVRPRLVVYDPVLLRPLRSEVARPSLLNALAHSIDALFDIQADDAVHALAEESAAAILAGLRDMATVGAPDEAPPDELPAVAEALYGAFLAGRVLDRARMAVHHKLAHVLGGSFGLPHAPTHAALLPFTLAFNQGHAPRAMRRLRRAFGAADPAAALFDLMSDLDVPVRLSALGLGLSDLDEVVSQVLARPYDNPRPVDRAGLRALLLAALHGRRPSLRVRRRPAPGGTGPHAALAPSLLGPALADARAVVLAIHGRGSSADAFIERIREQVGSGVTVIAPQAAGNSWYPGGFQDVDGNAVHLSSALSVLDAAFALATTHLPPERVVVVGFSQGACLALTWLSHRSGLPLPGALSAWTGAVIPGFEDFGDLAGMPVHVGTAAEDPWVDRSDVEQTVDALERAGADVGLQVSPGEKHEIRPTDLDALRRQVAAATAGDGHGYQQGFGNALHSEALPGAVPRQQNLPRHTPYGLYGEQINGTGFTVRRQENHRVWLYRLHPQIGGRRWERLPPGRFTSDFGQGASSPDLLRFAPPPWPAADTDFLAGLSTFAGAGDPTTRTGFAIHVYAATADMDETAFTDIDGDLLVVPAEGCLEIRTELGWLRVGPGEIAVLPRGIRFQVFLPDGRARGFVGELFNGHYQLPERGLLGANALADERHFQAPVASFEDRAVPYTIVQKQGGELWRTTVERSPFDVVGWHGTYAPFKYDLMDFNAYWGANWDHPDPSILTVLTCPHDDHGRNAVDFVVFKGRWDTTEHSFRPPFLHRNSAIEFNAVIRTPTTEGPYVTGASTYTPYLSPHGVSAGGYAREVAREEPAASQPHRHSDDELWIQFESTYSLRVMPWFLDREHGDPDYLDQFQGFPPASGA